MSGRALLPPINSNGELVEVSNAVERASAVVASQHAVVSFRNRPMLLDFEGYAHYRPLTKELFDRIAYPLLGGVTRGKMADVFSYLCNTAEDLTDKDHLILFGNKDTDLDESRRSIVWDTRMLSATAYEPTDCIWRSPFSQARVATPVPFVLSLAGGDIGLYGDIMQSIAPIIMAKKPDGAIWWVGDGANGKSTLMDALYQIFPNQLASLTVKSLTDGRDTPSLNGQLANIVKESSEGRIDDTEIYKSLGTHENFTVHKFHSQESITVMGNLHHIFNANTIPAFNDKGFSARRRTFIIPFTERFESDPSFEARTFTPEMFGQLIAEMCRFAKQIERQGFRYKWSAKTLGAKASYDTEANNAEEYAASIIQDGVVAFESFQPVKIDYENWCAENGYVPLGIGNMRRALQGAGFERMSYVEGERSVKHYRLPNIRPFDLQPFSLSRMGMFTIPGFTPEQEKEAPAPADQQQFNGKSEW